MLSSRFLPHFAFRNQVAVWPSGPETFGEGLRVHETAERLLAEVNQQTRSLLMISHGHFIRELLNHLLMTAEPNAFHHDNCGITALDYIGKWQLNFVNMPHEKLGSD